MIDKMSLFYSAKSTTNCVDFLYSFYNRKKNRHISTFFYANAPLFLCYYYRFVLTDQLEMIYRCMYSITPVRIIYMWFHIEPVFFYFVILGTPEIPNQWDTDE